MGYYESGGDEDLDIDKPIISPLTSEQIEQCKDPWESFSLEEEYYILYDSISLMAQDIIKANKLLSIAGILKAIGAPDNIETLRDAGFQAVCLAAWFAERIKEVPSLSKGELVQTEENLDKDKLRWGRVVRGMIAENEVLISIWGFRLEELATQVTRDAYFCARVEANLFNTPDNLFENHLEKAQVSAERAAHYDGILSSVKEQWVPKWAAGEHDIGDDIIAAIDAYTEKHKDEIRFLSQRKKAVYERIQKRVESDPAYQKYRKEAQDVPISGLPDLLSSLLKNEDCRNPNCPVHGETVRKQMHSSADQSPSHRPTPQLSSVNPSIEGPELVMAIDKNKDLKNSTPVAAPQFTNVSVQFVNDSNTRNIQLPKGMTYEEGRYWLNKIEEEETRTFKYEYQFVGWSPLDAMWAAYRALSELHGFVHVADFQSWFGPTPPSMITIDIDFGVTQQMPWGPIKVNSFSAPLVPSIALVNGHPTLRFSSTIRNNERHVVDALMKRSDDMLKTSSIFRGKAIEVDFEVVSPDDFRFDPTKAPKFWDTSKTNVDELILSKSVERLVRTNIWTPIRKTEAARRHQIPLRRTTLLAGGYGVGKTLAARATAKIAEDHGWTFLYLKKLNQLKSALYFAKKYQPCVIFAEDINRVTSGKRDEEMDELFNVIDGIDRKNDEVMLVFTTNNIDEIHPGMIRPGRIDTVITVTPPDADATERLVRLYGRGLIADDADLMETSNKLAGQIPAIIREAVERSKLAAIEDDDGEGSLVVRSEHLETAADQMLVHAELLRDPDEERPDMEVFGDALGRVIIRGMQFHDVGGSVVADSDKAMARDKFRSILEDSGLQGNGKHPSDEA